MRIEETKSQLVGKPEDTTEAIHVSNWPMYSHSRDYHVAQSADAKNIRGSETADTMHLSAPLEVVSAIDLRVLSQVGQAFQRLLLSLGTVEQIILFSEEGRVNIWTITNHLSGKDADAIYLREIGLRRKFPYIKFTFRLIQRRGYPLEHFITLREDRFVVIKVSGVGGA